MKLDKCVSQALALAGQFGFMILVPVFLCFWIGYRIDGWLGTNFIFIIFIFIGAFAGILNIFHLANKIGSSKKNKK